MPLSLAAALRWGAAAPAASARVVVAARCERVTKMSVDEERTRFVAEARLSGGGSEHELPICELLVRPPALQAIRLYRPTCRAVT